MGCTWSCLKPMSYGIFMHDLVKEAEEKLIRFEDNVKGAEVACFQKTGSHENRFRTCSIGLYHGNMYNSEFYAGKVKCINKG